MFIYLLNNPHFIFFCFAELIMQIGIGLTQVAVYGELAKTHAEPIYFSIAFSISIIPGLFSSHIGNKLAKKINLAFLLITIKLISSISLIIPLIGILKNNLSFLIFSEFISAFALGFIYPISQVYIKRVFTEPKYLPFAAKIDLIIFSVNIVFGSFIGSILYNLFSSRLYLLSNIFAYVFSALITLFCYFLKKEVCKKSTLNITSNKKISISNYFAFFKNISYKKLYSFSILIYLSITATPAMTLLPLIGNRYGTSINIFGSTLTPALVFILARSFGQIIGPNFIKNNNFDKIFKDKTKSFKYMFVFLILYLILYNINNIYLSILIIIIAHCISNIIFAFGMYALQSTFKVNEIGEVSAKQYQLILASMSIVSLLTPVRRNELKLSRF